MVLNRLDDGLLVTLLTKKVVAAQLLFLIDRHWEYKYLTCQKSAIKSVTNVLDNSLVWNYHLTAIQNQSVLIFHKLFKEI